MNNQMGLQCFIISFMDDQEAGGLHQHVIVSKLETNKCGLQYNVL